MLGLLTATALLMNSSQLANAELATAHVPASVTQIMEVPAALKEDFRLQVLSKSQLPQRRLELLAKYLFLPGGLGIRYAHDATYTVAQAYEHRVANCLTFTLLTVALAREAGLEAYGQDMAESLVWWQDDSATYRTTHVNAGIRIDQRRFTLDVASDQVLSRNPPTRIKDSRLFAQYYNNRSATLISQDQLDLALLYAQLTLAQDPSYAAGWNNAGVLHGRAGRSEEAERHFVKSLEKNPREASALANLAKHYERNAQPKLAESLQKRLLVVQKNNPFHQFMLAVNAEQAGDFEAANRYYRQAIRLHRFEPRFHTGLARTYLQLGKPQAAERALSRARALSEQSGRGPPQLTVDERGQRRS